jgi:heat shock protein HslJ
MSLPYVEGVTPIPRVIASVTAHMRFVCAHARRGPGGRRSFGTILHQFPFVLGVIASCFIACTAAQAQEAPADISVEGQVWQLREYLSAVGMRPATAGSGNLYTLFDGGRFLINAGCGTVQGRYWLDGAAMMFSPHVEALVQDCPELLRTQEEAVLDLLRRVDRMAISEAELVLMDHNDRRVLVLTQPDKAPLQGRPWRLTAYRDREGIIVDALPIPVFTLMFEDAGNISGRACDTYRAVYTRDDRFLRLVGPIAVSRIGCGDESAGRQGADFLELLGQVDSYRVDAETLLLRDENGRMLARFIPADSDDWGMAEAADPKSGADNLPPPPVPLLPLVR